MEKNNKMICGLPKCKKIASKYGVCDFHKAWYFISDDTFFNKEIERYKKIMQDLQKENTRINNLGLNIADIEKCWDGDLTKRICEFPKKFNIAGNLMEQMDQIKNELLDKYEKKLVENCTIRARHSSINNCQCICCKLQLKK